MDVTIGDDMMPTYEKKTFKDNKIILQDMDLRRVYFDNHIRDDIAQANDMSNHRYVSWDSFRTLEKNPMYFNIKSVGATTYSTD